MSESPICTALPATCAMPEPEPPPETLIFTSGCACWYALAASFTSGRSAVEPAIVMVVSAKAGTDVAATEKPASRAASAAFLFTKNVLRE